MTVVVCELNPHVLQAVLRTPLATSHYSEYDALCQGRMKKPLHPSGLSGFFMSKRVGTDPQKGSEQGSIFSSPVPTPDFCKTVAPQRFWAFSFWCKKGRNTEHTGGCRSPPCAPRVFGSSGRGFRSLRRATSAAALDPPSAPALDPSSFAKKQAGAAIRGWQLRCIAYSVSLRQGTFAA